MATFTMRVSDVLAHLFAESDDVLDYEIQYGEFEFDGVSYGKLPIIPDPTLIGLGTYPIFDEAYRPILNGKIVDEYFNREIGMETIDDWRLAMRRRMDQIMPYYNDIYKTTKMEFDPLITMDLLSQSEGETKSTEDVEASTITDSVSDSESRAVSSETPQTMLSGSGDYATNAADSKGVTRVDGSNNQESSSESNTENKSENRVRGYQGVASDLVMRYRSSIINVDTMIIGELEDCFMLLLNNGDSYTRNGWYY